MDRNYFPGPTHRLGTSPSTSWATFAFGLPLKLSVHRGIQEAKLLASVRSVPSLLSAFLPSSGVSRIAASHAAIATVHAGRTALPGPATPCYTVAGSRSRARPALDRPGADRYSLCSSGRLARSCGCRLGASLSHGRPSRRLAIGSPPAAASYSAPTRGAGSRRTDGTDLFHQP